jgi:hypothetical protein
MDEDKTPMLLIGAGLLAVLAFFMFNKKDGNGGGGGGGVNPGFSNMTITFN